MEYLTCFGEQCGNPMLFVVVDGLYSRGGALVGFG